MDNFRRRIAEGGKKITGTGYQVTNVVINSWNPPASVTRTFGSSSFYITEINITIWYEVYDLYDDGTFEYTTQTSWTGDVAPTILSRSTGYVGFYSYAAASLRLFYENRFIVGIATNNYDNNRIYKSDEDGTLVSYELYLYVKPAGPPYLNLSTYALNVYPFGKITLTKQGASGTGDVLQSCESYV